MTVDKIKQYFNAVYMYCYLRYYDYRLRTDTRYMIKEALKQWKR